jgi:hypothetical protein
MRVLAVLFSIAVLCLVGALSLPRLTSSSGSRDLDDLYVFAKHDTTGLCFYGEDWDNDNAIDSGTAGNVPCTPEVEKWMADHRRAR